MSASIVNSSPRSKPFTTLEAALSTIGNWSWSVLTDVVSFVSRALFIFNRRGEVVSCVLPHRYNGTQSSRFNLNSTTGGVVNYGAVLSGDFLIFILGSRQGVLPAKTATV